MDKDKEGASWTGPETEVGTETRGGEELPETRRTESLKDGARTGASQDAMWEENRQVTRRPGARPVDKDKEGASWTEPETGARTETREEEPPET